jgi:hypothetical protein
LITYKQHGSRHPTAAVSDGSNFDVPCNLSIASLTPKSSDSLVDKTEAMSAPGVKLAAMWIQWKIAIQSNSSPTFHKGPTFAFAAETQSCQPSHRQKTESIIEQYDIDIRPFQVGPRPERRTRVESCHIRHVGLMPPRSAMNATGDLPHLLTGRAIYTHNPKELWVPFL